MKVEFLVLGMELEPVVVLMLMPPESVLMLMLVLVLLVRAPPMAKLSIGTSSNVPSVST